MPQTNNNNTGQWTITLPNSLEELPRLSALVEEVCEEIGCDMEMTMRINLAMEEAVVNVIDYAYPPGTVGYMEIKATTADKRIKFMIIDSGTPFDPTKKEEVDISLPVEERRIGGLGIHLVRQIMDDIKYERKEGHNVLTLVKKI